MIVNPVRNYIRASFKKSVPAFTGWTYEKELLAIDQDLENLYYVPDQFVTHDLKEFPAIHFDDKTKHRVVKYEHGLSEEKVEQIKADNDIEDELYFIEILECVVCQDCGERCEVTFLDESFDYAGTHCTGGKPGTAYGPSHGLLVSVCCEATNEDWELDEDMLYKSRRRGRAGYRY